MSTSPWDCLSCGGGAQTKAFCEQCGAAQPIDGEDFALSMMLGLVCDACDAYNDPGESACSSCGTPLGSDLPAPAPPPATPPPSAPPSAPSVSAAPPLDKPRAEPPSWMSAPTGKPLSTQFALPKVDLATIGRVAVPPMPSAAPKQTSSPMGAAQGPPCGKCGTLLELDNKFCRVCGARSGESASPLATAQIDMLKMPSPLSSPMLKQGATMVMPAMRVAQQADALGLATQPEALPSATMVFGAATAERFGKLVLVRGQSQYGSQWRLQAKETVIGRSEGAVLFPDDATLAPAHCKLVFRGADLWLEPAPTQNGVFLRVRDLVRLSPGDEIVVGAQRLRILTDPERPLLVKADPSTRTLGSLVRASPPIMLLRIGSDPVLNEVFHRCQRLLTIGRNNCDLNFPRDSFVSERHAQITHDGNALVLEDLRSRNGTYIRLQTGTKLQHGDLVLLGDKVLRVELPR